MRAAQGMFKGVGVGRAMALEHQAAQAQQGRAVVAAVVHAALEMVEHRQRNQRGQLAVGVAGEFLFDELAQHGRQPFRGLEQHIAHKTVAHHHVGGAFVDVVAFHIAMEVQVARGMRRPQPLGRFLDHLAALDGLFANVEQAHGGLRFALGGGDQGAAHQGELQQVFGAAVDVGAQVQHRGVAIGLRGHHRGNGRSVDAVEGFQHIAGHGHQGTGVAGRHASVGCGCNRPG